MGGGFNLGDPGSWLGADLGATAGGALGTLATGGVGLIPGAIAGGVLGGGGSIGGISGPSGGILNGAGDALGLGTPPNQDPYQINPQAFQNPAGDQGGALSLALRGYTQNAYQPLGAASSPYTGAAGAGLGALGGQYAALASGQGPSLANVQAQQQGAQNLQGAESMLGSARGAGSPAAAQLAAQRALTGGQQQIAQNAVAGRTAEEMGALGGMGSAYGALGGLGTTVQGQQNQVGQGNQALNAAVQGNYLGALGAQGAQQQQGAIAGQQLAAQNAATYANIAANNYNQGAQRRSQFLGSVLQGGAGLAAAAL